MRNPRAPRPDFETKAQTPASRPPSHPATRLRGRGSRSTRFPRCPPLARAETGPGGKSAAGEGAGAGRGREEGREEGRGEGGEGEGEGEGRGGEGEGREREGAVANGTGHS